jgi:hypothetical protein
LIQAKCTEHEIPDGLTDRLRTLLATAETGPDHG